MITVQYLNQYAPTHLATRLMKEAKSYLSSSLTSSTLKTIVAVDTLSVRLNSTKSGAVNMGQYVSKKVRNILITKKLISNGVNKKIMQSVRK
jgi:hypothetical protein